MTAAAAVRRDPHSYAPDDPPIVMTRQLAVTLLEGAEMFRDIVTLRAGKSDPSLDQQIARLTDLLSAPEDPDVVILSHARTVTTDMLDQGIDGGGAMLLQLADTGCHNVTEAGIERGLLRDGPMMVKVVVEQRCVRS